VLTRLPALDLVAAWDGSVKREALGEQDVHVWFAAPDRLLAAPDAVGRSLSLLDMDEARRYRAFHHDHDRHCFLAAHVLLRLALSHHAGVAPGDWVFERDSHGRPGIVGPAGAPPTGFSLSHTGGMVACAVSQHAEIGVDVELMLDDAPFPALAEHFFAPSEYDDICLSPDLCRSDRFYTYWTLKEAYIKARGLGMSLPLDGFAFEIGKAGACRIGFREDFDDTPDLWQFVAMRLEPRHRLALAVRRPGAEEMQFLLHPAETSAQAPA
jgi:4'-phosphopantetheinyl transferase